MKKILQKLKGEDLRSIGKANEVVQDILERPVLFEEVFEGMFVENPVIKMRSSDVIEKVSKVCPGYLQPYKDKLIRRMLETTQKEVRWHMAQIVTYLELNKDDISTIIDILLLWIETENSKIVIVNSIQALAEFAKEDKNIRKEVIKIINNTINGNSPSIVNRGKKLIKELRNL